MKKMEFSIRKFSQIDSTNEEALRLIADRRAKEGIVLQADSQTRGRGAGQNNWESEPGKNLTFSVILEPHFLEPSKQFVLTEMISLALFDVVERRLGNEGLFIKWPNDLWFHDKKLAGVLVQNRVTGNQLEYSVVGVGLNVNQKNFYSDAPNPGSMIHFSGKKENLSRLLDEILIQFSIYYQKIIQNEKSLENSYLQRLFQMGKWADYSDAAGRFTAQITGINQYGQLILSDRQGKQRVYGFKEIEFLT